MLRLIDCKGPLTRRCKQLRQLQRLQKIRESPLSIFGFEPPEVTEPEPQVQVPRQRSECWLVMVSGLAELKTLRLSRTTGLADLVADAADASSSLGVFLNVLRLSDPEDSG